MLSVEKIRASKRNYYYKHQDEILAKHREKVLCPLCSKPFQKYYLKYHLQSHDGRIMCSICEKSFAKAYLKVHLAMMHDGQYQTNRET